MPTTTPSATTAVLTDRQAFLAAVRASGLLSPTQLAKATAAIPDHAATAAQTAQFLVATGHLTRFQADRLLAGKADGFVIDPYVIREQIGRGNSGRVFQAVHRTMSRTVAIKVLAPELTRTPADRAAFRREAQAAAKLNHPNVVTAFDANERGERAYLVTEYVDGPNLAQMVKERGPLPVAEACELVRQVATGLQHAHEQGMTHRDIKPTNLLVARASKTLPGCVVKIADFGVARLALAAPPDDTQLPAAGGTADFAAPEATGDHRADLYALGGVFYFLLTGRPPFPGGTPEAKARRHREEAAVPVERVRPDVSPAVAEVVRRLLAKDPNARLQSAAALASRLDGLSAGSVVGDDDGAFITFDLPPVGRPSGVYNSGYLTGMIPRPQQRAAAPAAVADTSPWAELTDEVQASGSAGGRRPARSPVALLVAVGALAATALVVAGVLLKVLAR